MLDYKNSTFLVTGGAGFIGSNIVKRLIKENAKKVVVLDNFVTGNIENLEGVLELSNLEVLEGDINNMEVLEKAMLDVNYISHQAALGSVPRSIKDPVSTNQTNVGGFINLLWTASKNKSVKKVVYAASSSTYGDSTEIPKRESIIGKPLSPYAVSKLVNEIYAENFSKIYEMKLVGLRYFNVFGPNQNPNNPYAAVIPLFFKQILNNQSPIVNGSLKISRDFTYVDNVVEANLLAMSTDLKPNHSIFNVACGKKISLGKLIEEINLITGKNVKPEIRDYRKGDVMHSLASIELIRENLGYQPLISFKEGLKKSLEYYNELFSKE